MARCLSECYRDSYKNRTPGCFGGKAETIGRRNPPGAKGMRKGNTMGRIIKALIYLILVGFIGISIYAYVGDLSPDQTEVTKTVGGNGD